MMASPRGGSISQASEWQVVNDTVMGGVSQSNVEELETGMVFSGTLSLDNNGGFTSTRRAIISDWSQAESIRMRVKGDGRRYIATARVQGRAMSRIYYRQAFDTIEDTWLEVELPIDEFEAYAYGRRMPTVPRLSRVADTVETVGLMLADGNPGPFSIEVQIIETVQNKALPLTADHPSASVQEVFASAISEGAPLFNQGHADRCADIYQSAIVTVLLLNPADLIPEDHERLADAVRAARSVETQADRAWLLRDAMDSTMSRK
jgi:hypothetical protein